MPAFTPFNYEEDIRNKGVIVVCSYGPDNDTAVQEIEQWAYEHGYTRGEESNLNVRRNISGQTYFYSTCHLVARAESGDKDVAVTPDTFGGREKNSAPPSSAHLIRERTAERGRDLYERYIHPNLGDRDFGKYVSVDVDVNHPLDYEIGDDHITTAERIFARRPNAILYTVRVGYPSVVTMRRRSIRAVV